MKRILLFPAFLILCCVSSVAPALGAPTPPPGSDSTVVTVPPAESPAVGKAVPGTVGTVDGTATADGTGIADGTGTADGTGVADGTGTADGTGVTTTTEETTIITRTVDPGYLKVTLPRLSARGPNLVSASLGLRAGLTDNSPGGFLFATQYAWQVSRAFWLDSQFAASFGGRCDPTDEVGKPTICGGLSGFGADILVGVMMQFLNWPAWNIPLNPYARVLTGVTFIISNGPNDGAAIVVRGAGGLRYAFTDEFSVGAEVGLMLGPSFRNDVGSGGYAAFDFLLAAEFSF